MTAYARRVDKRSLRLPPGPGRAEGMKVTRVAHEWHIAIDNQEQRRKVALVEGRARRDDHAEADDEVEFSFTLYRDQASLNLPATTQGREFIAWLTKILGPPRLEPTVKCSCSWGDGVMGAMLIVLWDLPADPASPVVQSLHNFLGTQSPAFPV